MAFDLSAILRVKDQASSAFRSATEASRRFKDQMRQLGGQMNQANRDTNMFGRTMDGLKSRGSGTLSMITKMTTAVGGLAIAYKGVKTGTDAISRAMDFESQLLSIEALTNLDTSGMATVKDLALQVGADTKFSALEAGRGIEELLKAGMSLDKVMGGGGLRAALDLAVSGNLELAEAAEIMATSLNAFSNDAMEPVRAANLLQGAANASATSVHEMRYSLAAVSAVAGGMKMTMEDTATAIGLFANNGFKGSDAGTSLKTMLMNLIPTTKDQIALSKELGLMTKNGTNAFFDQNRQMRSIAEIAGILQKSMAKLTDEERLMHMETLFGSDAIRAANILFKEGSEGAEKFAASMGEVTAAGVAEKKMSGAAGAVERLAGAWETMKIEAGTPFLSSLASGAEMLGNYIERNVGKVKYAIQNEVDYAKNYIKTNFINNQEFRDLPTWNAKIGFVVSSLKEIFDQWYNNEGREHLRSGAKKTIDELAYFLEGNTGPIVAAGLKMGASLAAGLAEGLWSAVKNHPILSGIIGAVVTPGGVGGKLIAANVAMTAANTGRSYDGWKRLIETGDLVDTVPKWLGGDGKTPMRVNWGGLFGPENFMVPDTPNGHSGGIKRVPYNNYPALLHKNEEVVTAGEARKDRDGRGGLVVHFNGDITVGSRDDLDELVNKLYDVISDSNDAMGGVEVR